MENGNLTWRYYTRRCEYIRPIQEYVQSGHWPNYQDFLADNPEFRDLYAAHDTSVIEAESRAAKFCDLLLQSSIFPKDVNQSLQEYEATLKPSEPGFYSLVYMEKDLPKYVAEYLVNEVETLPPHYTTHKFWKEYRARFWEKHSVEFEPYKGRESFQLLASTKRQLAQRSAVLKQQLEDHRLFLCRKFDIPAAPTGLTVDVGSSF